MRFRKDRPILLNIFVFIVAVCISFIIGEVAARMFHLSKTYNSYPHLVRADKRVEYSLQKNSYGWKDREFTKSKKPGTFRIACIGDSVTEGYRIIAENTFPKVLESRLQDMGYDVEVMNLGRCGNDTIDNLLSLKAVMEFDPDFVIYQFGMNDIESFEHRERVFSKDVVSTNNNMAKKKNEFNLKAILRKSVLYLALAERYNYFKLRAGYKNWAFDDWDIKDQMLEKEFFKLKEGFSEIEDHLKILVCYMPYDFQVYSTREEALVPSKKMGKFCQDNGCYFVDFIHIFKAQKNKYGLFLDDAHLSGYGHRIAGEYLADFVVHKKIL